MSKIEKGKVGRTTSVAINRRLNPHQLEAFEAIVATGSITGAAKRLNVSQPGVSRRLADLEYSIGFSLFVRNKKRLLITPEGTIFYNEVSQSFVGLDRLAHAANEIRQLRRGHVSMWAMPALCFGIVPQALKGFLDENSSLKVTCHAHNSQRIIEGVAAQGVDFGIAQCPAEYPGIRTHSSYTAKCVCVMRPDHRLCVKEEIMAIDLNDENLVFLPPSSTAGRQLDLALSRARVSVVPRIETLASFAACSMVAAGIGIAVIDPFTATSFAHGLVEVRPFVPEIAFNFRIIQPRERIPSKIGEALITHLADAFCAHPLVRSEAP